MLYYTGTRNYSSNCHCNQWTVHICHHTSVESGLPASTIIGAGIDTSIGNRDLPYADNPSQATSMMLNSNTPVDLNGKPKKLLLMEYTSSILTEIPPFPCPLCDQRIGSVACQLLRRQAMQDGRRIPRPCQQTT